MSIDAAFERGLFANDFLCDTIAGTPDWQAIDDATLDDFGIRLRALFERFHIDGSPNESQTEDDLIWPVLGTLGWTASLRQQNLSAAGRDGLLFADVDAKDQANRLAREWMRYELGLAVVESKRWHRPLDRRSGRAGEERAPSTQVLRYLRRIDDLTEGRLRLTNGAVWRLYYQVARSVSEQFFEIDLTAILDLPDHNRGLFALDEAERRHGLKMFALIFGRDAFLPGTADERTFHQRAIDEGRFYEERVAGNLSELVFGQVSPELARAIATAAPDAPLSEVREATLILLYRLLFILYAEDRDLLPVRATITRCVTGYAAMSAAARTWGTCSPRSRRAIGRRSTIYAAQSMRETSRSVCRPTSDPPQPIDLQQVSLSLQPAARRDVLLLTRSTSTILPRNLSFRTHLRRSFPSAGGKRETPSGQWSTLFKAHLLATAQHVDMFSLHRHVRVKCR
ncbi:MAG: hypothetical protein OXC93_07335 [Rhodospirillaceae bacterium]|nr:hypothetical protein [Rhodospirillaceae bacterium]